MPSGQLLPRRVRCVRCERAYGECPTWFVQVPLSLVPLLGTTAPPARPSPWCASSGSTVSRAALRKFRCGEFCVWACVAGADAWPFTARSALLDRIAPLTLARRVRSKRFRAPPVRSVRRARQRLRPVPSVRVFERSPVRCGNSDGPCDASRLPVPRRRLWRGALRGGVHLRRARHGGPIPMPARDVLYRRHRGAVAGVCANGAGLRECAPACTYVCVCGGGGGATM